MGFEGWYERPESGGLARRLRMRIGVVVGLLFLAGPLSDLARSSLGGGHVAAIAAGAAVFVWLYVSLLPPSPWLLRLDRRAPLVALALLAVLAIVLPLGGAPRSFYAFFVYFVAAAGILLRPRHAVAIFTTTAIAVGTSLAASGATTSAVASTVLTIVAIGAMMAAFGRQIAANRALREAREELARLAVSEERLRIARDLHDLLGHSLSVVALKSELAEKLVARDPERAVAELVDIQAVSRQALTEVREAVQDYRRLALPEALDGARTALAAAGIALDLDGADVALPAEVEAVLAWAVREGTTNVVRHSNARTCAIRLRADTQSAEVEVEDDGVGASTNGSTNGHTGSGLAGLAERAECVRGRLEADVRPEGGFRLRLTVPLVAT